MKINIQKASMRDADLVYSLRNEKTARKNSLNSKKIELKDHVKWFQKKINIKKNLFYIIKSKNLENIGIVRYDFENVFAYVSINVSKNYRNLGYGAMILKKTEKLIKRDAILIAFVRKQNINSKKIFTKNKYQMLKSGNQIIFVKIIKKNK
jgi:ribosomal protein S18 acetylase RimI-like enzyme